MSDETKYLQPDGTAECPLPGYTGTIRFPMVMTLSMHKRWQKFVNARSGRDPDDPNVGVAFNAEADEGERIVFVYDDVELALMFGDLDLTGPKGKRFNPKSPDDLPLPVAVWMAKCYREWENSQLLFRWNGRAGVAAPVSAG